MAKAKSLYEVTAATIDRLQMRSTILGNSEIMEIYIRRPRTSKVCRIKVINLRLIKMSKEGRDLTYSVRNCGRIAAHLKLRRDNREWT